MSVQPGWQGRFYEDFAVGYVYIHTPGRTVIAADNVWFTLLTMNPNPIHFNQVYALGPGAMPLRVPHDYGKIATRDAPQRAAEYRHRSAAHTAITMHPN